MPKLSLHPSSEAVKIFFLNQDQVQSHPQAELFKNLKFTGKYKEVLLLPETRVVYVGRHLQPTFKTIDPFWTPNFFELGASIVRSLEKTDLTHFQIENFEGLDSQKLFDLVLGMFQASYVFDKYQSPKNRKPDLILNLGQNVGELVTGDFETRLTAFQNGLTLTRRLVDDTPEAINPGTIIDIVKSELGSFKNVSLNFMDYDQILAENMQGISYMGRASRFKPVLVHAVLKPNKTVKTKICLVGKGVTFDSGGYNLKPDGGQHMKCDMAGAATMFGVIKILAELGLENTEVHWISAFTENLIDGSAYKPDDVLTTYSGQTVEIFNTDAEGRLNLADTLTLATLQDPDYIVDAATLTGAAVMAVSDYNTLLVGNDRQLVDNLFQSMLEVQEPTIYMPLPEVLRQYLKGKIADLNNTHTLSKQAGHLTAGLFLSHFVDQNLYRNPNLQIDNPKTFAWAHLDIAPSAFNSKHNLLQVDGATGQGVRGLVRWISKLDA
jgi:leucyl aminopeptidase